MCLPKQFPGDTAEGGLGPHSEDPCSGLHMPGVSEPAPRGLAHVVDNK